jgi:NHL repeat
LLNAPYGVALDTAGNLYIGDANNSRIRKVDTTGTISTVAGNGICGFGGNGGNASAAILCHPLGVATDSAGNLYIADFGNGRFRIVNSAGIIAAFAGSGSGGYNGDGLDPSKTDFDGPVAVAVNPLSGVVYMDDDEQYRVRRLTK